MGVGGGGHQPVDSVRLDELERRLGDDELEYAGSHRVELAVLAGLVAGREDAQLAGLVELGDEARVDELVDGAEPEELADRPQHRGPLWPVIDAASVRPPPGDATGAARRRAIA